MNKKILWITDMDFKESGYYRLSVPLCEGLAKDNDVKVLGFSYKGEEHSFPFSIIPVGNYRELNGMIANLIKIWMPDVIIVTSDVPKVETIHGMIEHQSSAIPVIAVTPLENPPLCFSWTASLMKMNHVFFISEIANMAGVDAGLMNSSHLPIPIDTEFWCPTDDKKSVREKFGWDDSTVVLLTVGDNQERKHLLGAMEIVSQLKKDGMNVRHVLVTKDATSYGARLRDASIDLFDTNQETHIVDAGIPKMELREYYRGADFLLHTSKAEGLGLTVLEAMACGLPVVATETGAMPELLGDGRGTLIPAAHRFLDVWGNSYRDLIDIQKAAHTIRAMSEYLGEFFDDKNEAREFVVNRTQENAVGMLEKKIEEMTNEN